MSPISLFVHALLPQLWLEGELGLLRHHGVLHMVKAPIITVSCEWTFSKRNLRDLTSQKLDWLVGCIARSCAAIIRPLRHPNRLIVLRTVNSFLILPEASCHLCGTNDGGRKKKKKRQVENPSRRVGLILRKIFRAAVLVLVYRGLRAEKKCAAASFLTHSCGRN